MERSAAAGGGDVWRDPGFAVSRGAGSRENGRDYSSCGPVCGNDDPAASAVRYVPGRVYSDGSGCEKAPGSRGSLRLCLFGEKNL